MAYADHNHGMHSLKGKLLVASPLLIDPHFFRSVVFLLEHDSEGALGIVLDNPSDVSPYETLPSWSPMLSDPQVFFLGGPVNPDSVIGVGVLKNQSADLSKVGLNDMGIFEVTERIVTVDLGLTGDSVGSNLLGLRLFAGYAGWTKNQLDAEITDNSWFVVDPNPETILSDTPKTLWHDSLKRHPGRAKIFASYPKQPSFN